MSWGNDSGEVPVIRGEPLQPPPRALVTNFLRHHPLFATFTPEQLDWIATRARLYQLAPGEALIEQGAPPRGITILISGQVGILRDHHGVALPLGLLETGDICAEISALSGKPAVATARATDRCVAIEISCEDLNAIAAVHHELAASLRKLACERIEELRAIAANTESYREGRIPII